MSTKQQRVKLDTDKTANQAVNLINAKRIELGQKQITLPDFYELAVNKFADDLAEVDHRIDHQ